MIETLFRRISAVLAIVLLTSNLVVPLAGANQDAAAVTDFTVGAFVCPYDPGPVSVYAGTVPADCMPVAGMTMHVVTDTLTETSCSTGDAGVCSVSVPAESWLTITENNAARPDLVPVMNPLVTSAAAMDAVFVHVVAPVTVPEPVVTDPVVPDPIVVDPVVTDPVVTDPVVTDPVEGDPIEGAPVVPDPADGEPVVPDPVVGEPVVTDPVEGEPVVTDPVEGEPVITDPVEGEPVVDAPAEGDPEVIDPNQTDIDTGGEGDVSDNDPVLGYVTNAGANGLVCFAAPDPNSPQLHLLFDGDQVTILSNADNGFVQVACATSDGYVYAENVTIQAVPGIPMESVAGTPSATPSASPEVLVSATPSASPQVIPAGTPDVARTMVVAAEEEPLKPRLGVEMVVNAPLGKLICYSEPNELATIILTFVDGNQFYTNGIEVDGWLPIECGERNGYVTAKYTTLYPNPIPAPATSVEMVTGVGSVGLACRTAPHRLATVITTLPEGAKFYATGPVKDGWLPVQCNGRDGYIPGTLTTVVPQPPKAATSVEMVTGVGSVGLACRTAPHRLATVITTLPEGAKFYATGPVKDGWLPVQCNGRDGYIPGTLTTVVPQPPKAATSVEMVTGVGSVGLACRTAPHRLATVITTLPEGAKFYATGPVKDGWLPVQCNGRDGYIPGTLTTVVPQPPKAATSVEMVTGVGSVGLACRTAPHRLATVITTLPEGAKFYATGPVKDGWLPVQCNGRDGYIPGTLTTVVPQPPKAATSVEMVTGVGSVGLACRTAPHRLATVITTIPNNTLLSITGAATNGWLPVQCGGRDGYVLVQYTTIASQPLKSVISSATIFNTGKIGTVCRSAPSVDSRAITTVYEGASVKITGPAVQNWLPVQCAERNGFIHMVYTTIRVPHQDPGASGRAAIVQGTGSAGLACRTVAGGGTLITTLAERSPVEVLSWANGWANIRCGGTTGYALMRYLTFNASDPWTTTERIWIDVNLSSQYMIVYQGERIVGQTYVSTGRWPDFETPTGTFYIGYKIRVSDMSGCSGGECWYVPSVPYQMYFTDRGHAFHAAYWHNDFGTRRSHGCVNLPVGIAEWLYNITPVGTRVVIHY